jgi:hypothetical protein
MERCQPGGSRRVGDEGVERSLMMPIERSPDGIIK